MSPFPISFCALFFATSCMVQAPLQNIVWADENQDVMSFNGIDSGFFIEENPVADMSVFTIELRIRPDADGAYEQRFFHFEDTLSNRGLLELRLHSDSTWSLDTFLYNHATGERLTLLDTSRRHPSEEWTWVALSYDGKTMRHYVNGKEEASGEIFFPLTTVGRTSIGMRQNRVSWYKGQISHIHIHNHLKITSS
jgi:hypothetical protein